MELSREQVQEWVDSINAELKPEFEQQFGRLQWQPITIDGGRKWFRLMRGTSAWAFVAKGDCQHKGAQVSAGDLMKPANFKSPAKHARGNIMEGTARYTWTGPAYL